MLPPSRANEFFALKRRYDPDELFQNQFYVKYGRDAMTRLLPRNGPDSGGR